MLVHQDPNDDRLCWQEVPLFHGQRDDTQRKAGTISNCLRRVSLCKPAWHRYAVAPGALEYAILATFPSSSAPWNPTVLGSIFQQFRAPHHLIPGLLCMTSILREVHAELLQWPASLQKISGNSPPIFLEWPASVSFGKHQLDSDSSTWAALSSGTAGIHLHERAHLCLESKCNLIIEVGWNLWSRSSLPYLFFFLYFCFEWQPASPYQGWTQEMIPTEITKSSTVTLTKGLQLVDAPLMLSLVYSNKYVPSYVINKVLGFAR